MSTKTYLCPICGKGVKSTSGLTRNFNVCKSHFYPKPQPSYKPPQHKFHNKEDTLGGNWKDESDLLGEIVTIATVNGTFETPTKDTLWK